MRFGLALLSGLLVAASLAAGGCDFIKKQAPTITRVTVAAKIGVPGAGVQGELRKGTPENLPLWEGASVLRSDVIKSDAGNSWSATLRTTDPYVDVMKGMVVGFQKAGWQVESQDTASTEGSTTVLTVSSASDMGIVTITAQKDQSTRIGYAITRTGQ
jgi:hypothetical protein